MRPETYTVLGIIVLIVAAIPIVYGVGFFVWAWLDYRKQERRPKVLVNHPELGQLIGQDGLWTGEKIRDGQKIRLWIGGSTGGPDPALVATAQRALASLADRTHVAKQHLIQAEPEILARPAGFPAVEPSAFTLETIECLWPSDPNRFCLEFALEGDVDGIWRVEFENDQPVSTGRDD